MAARTAVVSGRTRGIGLEQSRRLSGLGHHVVAREQRRRQPRHNALIPGFTDTPEAAERYRMNEPEPRRRVLSQVPLGRIGIDGGNFMG